MDSPTPGRLNGRGALVTASRSVIYAFDPADRQWVDAVRRAADALRRELAAGLGVGS